MKLLRDDDYCINLVKCPKHRRPETERKHIGITGGDCLDRDDWRSFTKTLDRVLFPFDDPVIVTMGPPNMATDRLVQKYCHKNWLVHKVHHLDKSKPKVTALEMRLVDFLNDCNLLLVFSEEGCEKTEYIITLAQCQFLSLKIVKV